MFLENETVPLVPSQSSSSTSIIYIESESDYESLDEYCPFGAPEAKVCRSARQVLTGKDLQPTASRLVKLLHIFANVFNYCVIRFILIILLFNYLLVQLSTVFYF